jgi:integrase/recombinase XerD
MAGKQAKILSSDALKQLLAYASSTRYPIRNAAIVLLSVKAGLRAGEIAKLTWPMILDSEGEPGRLIELQNKAAKKGSGRLIPIHPELADALRAWADTQASLEGFVIKSERGGPMTPLSIVIWFRRAFARTGLKGCSSHSGRRTFITRAARLVHKTGGSLRDVQLLAGHASILTTQRYIDGDTDAQRRLVTLI